MGKQPFKFRHVNKISGTFVFVSLGILVALIAVAGKLQQWFVPGVEYRVEFAEEDGTLGIKEGSTVKVFGNQVGHVSRIEMVHKDTRKVIDSFDKVAPTDVRIVAVLEVKGPFTHFIGEGSEAFLKNDLGGLGSAYFDITRGTERRTSGNYLKIRKEKDVKDQMLSVAENVQKEVGATLASITATSDETGRLIAALGNYDGDLFGSINSLNSNLKDLNNIISDVEEGKGALGKLLKDKQTEESIDDTFTTKIPDTIVNLNTAIDKLEDGIDTLMVGVGSFNTATAALVGTVGTADETIAGIGDASDQTFEMMRESEVLVEGLQRHWLVRRFVKDEVEEPDDDSATQPVSTQKKRSRTGIFGRRHR